jgi:hypothetical protein
VRIPQLENETAIYQQIQNLIPQIGIRWLPTLNLPHSHGPRDRHIELCDPAHMIQYDCFCHEDFNILFIIDEIDACTAFCFDFGR